MDLTEAEDIKKRWQEYTEELMPSNCSTAEDSWEFLGLKGDQTTQL